LNTIYLRREKSDDGGRVGDKAEDTEGREENALAPKLKLLPNLFVVLCQIPTEFLIKTKVAG